MFYIFIFYFQEVLSTLLSKKTLEKYLEKKDYKCNYAIKTTSSLTFVACLNLKYAMYLSEFYIP